MTDQKPTPKPEDSTASNSTRLLFADKYPCIYKGALLCSACDKYKPGYDPLDEGCDMAMGRLIRQEAFVIGHDTALDRIVPEIMNILSSEVVVAGLVNFETIRKSIAELKGN